ncbi:MAG: prolipoprotein diacylglyceryl transferase [Desulfobacteraceae bacterium]|jgi:phosphatidylglycerol:prolipoprotein diacylglycerol transferase
MATTNLSELIDMHAFWSWWQHLPQKMDPVIFEIGSFKLQYYGLMYLVAFGVTYALAAYRIKKESRWDLTAEQLQGLLTSMIIGLVIGARLGYVIFYNLGYYIQHPLEIILPVSFSGGFHFTGISGMSYHGGLICTILGAWWYIHKNKLKFREMADLCIPCIPAAYMFGRIGNFINGELWGRATTVPWGMYFPTGGPILRHPSQLYEASGEGILLFFILWPLRNKVSTPGAMLSLYLIGYGAVRFVIEYFRQPDEHLGFVLFSFSMGQLLCSAMMIAGVALLLIYRKSNALPA